jgi:hypothetical protein
LHNNPAELDGRRRVRKRVVSYGPRSEHGVKGWDTIQTLFATAKKLGVNGFQYVCDRISGVRQPRSLLDGAITLRPRFIEKIPVDGVRGDYSCEVGPAMPHGRVTPYPQTRFHADICHSVQTTPSFLPQSSVGWIVGLTPA